MSQGGKSTNKILNFFHSKHLLLFSRTLLRMVSKKDDDLIQRKGYKVPQTVHVSAPVRPCISVDTRMWRPEAQVRCLSSISLHFYF